MDPLQIEAPDWTSVLTGEILLLGLLAKAIYSDPDKNWIQALIDEDVFSGVPIGSDEEETKIGLEYLNRWVKEQNGEVSEASLTRLKTDNLALFIGPGKMHVPLWESVYFTDEHLIFQERTLAVRYWYRRFGLEPERLNQEPDDHIGLELSFMAHLAMLALQAFEEHNTAEFEKYLKAQKDFFRDHLMLWGPDWAKLVIQHAQTDFYRGMGHLTLGSLQAVAHVLQIEIPVKAQ